MTEAQIASEKALKEKIDKVAWILDEIQEDLNQYVVTHRSEDESSLMLNEYSRFMDLFWGLECMFGNTRFILGLEADYQKDPSLKNMLLLEISRLEKSSDEADIHLRKFLKRIFQDKKYIDNSFNSQDPKARRHDIYHHQAPVQLAVELMKTKGYSARRAAGIISKKTGCSSKTIQNQISFIIKAERENAAAMRVEE